jgi:hypothetical protein
MAATEAQEDLIECSVCARCLPSYSFYPKNKQCKQCKEDKRLAKQQGSSLALRQKLLAEQDGKCDICRHPIALTSVELRSGRCYAAVGDHCHVCVKPRGLLCSNCNTAIGLLNEDVKVLDNAIAYLTRWHALHVDCGATRSRKLPQDTKPMGRKKKVWREKKNLQEQQTKEEARDANDIAKSASVP